MTTTTTHAPLSGLDLSTPGSLDRLFSSMRSRFGDARMGPEEGDATEGGQAEPDAKPDDLGEAGKKALDAERKSARAEKKRADDLAAKVKEFEDRDKSADEKAAEREKAAEARAVAAEGRALRAEIAAETGIPAGLLSGADEASLRASATALSEWRGAGATSAPTKTTPNPDPSQGGSGGQSQPAGAQGREQAARRYGIPAGAQK